MGCGASTSDREVESEWSPDQDTNGDYMTSQESMESEVSRIRRASLTLVEDFTRSKAILPDIPENYVLASARRPDWHTNDYLVFEVNECEEEEDDDISPRPSCSRGSRRSRRSRKTVVSNEGIEKKKVVKEGRFFSQMQSTCGTWRIKGNVLTLIWGLSLRTDTLIASDTPRRWLNSKISLGIHILEPKGQNPEWFLPDFVAEKFQSESVASKCFECPVCYFELPKFPVGVLRMHSRRCCGHYFHYKCASYLLKSMQGSGRPGTCSVCGVAFSEVKAMPDLMTNPNDWFCVVDVDLGGDLDAYEVIEALGTVMPLNRHKLEKNVKAHWHEWDPDLGGSISLEEFNKPEVGLKDWLLNHFSLVKAEPSFAHNTIPSIDQYPRLWFHYWDRNGDGELEREEIVRALVRTFSVDENGQISLVKAHDLRECANSLWTAMGYSAIDVVTLDDFVQPYGLMDQFLHNQSNCAYFGADVAIEELE